MTAFHGIRYSHPGLGSRVVEIAEAVAKAGGRAFVVGGAVRDAFLGRQAHEADLEVYGLEAELLERLVSDFGALHLVGRQFAILHLHTDVGNLEISLPRLESKTGPGHKGFRITADPHLSPKDAARRRDFTVNAMLFDPLREELTDPWNGVADLRAGLLRHVSPAFAEDPLRVMRVARFVARFRWRVHPDTIRFCRQLDLSELPRERFEAEWRQVLLRGDYPGAGIRALSDVGGLRYFPEIAALQNVPQDPLWHPEGDVFHHTCLALNAGASRRDEMTDPWVEMLSILCHDFGKPACTVFERGRWRSADHDTAGESPTRSFLNRLTEQEKVVEAVVALVRQHLRPMQLYQARDRVKDAAIRRLALKVDLPSLVRVAWADGAGRGESWPVDWPAGQWLLQRAAQLGVQEGKPKPFLRGRDVLDLGISPGPQVGEVLRAAFEHQLDGVFQERSEALTWLKDRLRS